MDNFLKKHSTLLKTTALILMLGVPFLLYAAAAHNAIFQVKLLLVLMGANMLYVMLRGYKLSHNRILRPSAALRLEIKCSRTTCTLRF